MTSKQAYSKDAEAAGRYCAAYIHPLRRWEQDCDLDVIEILACWAFHWASLALT